MFPTWSSHHFNQIDARPEHPFELLAIFRKGSEHAAVGVHPDASALAFRVFHHFDHLRMEERFTAAGAPHPGAVLAALVGHLLPQRHGHQIALVLVVEPPQL